MARNKNMSFWPGRESERGIVPMKLGNADRGKWYMAAVPSKESQKRVKKKIRRLLRPGEKGAWAQVRDRLNALLRGWCQYYCYGWTQPAYRGLERNVYNRVRRFLVCRHKVRSRGILRWPSERVFGELGVLLPRPVKTVDRRVPRGETSR